MEKSVDMWINGTNKGHLSEKDCFMGLEQDPYKLLDILGFKGMGKKGFLVT